MKAIIRLTDLSRSGAAVKALDEAINSDASLQARILENGVLFSGLQPAAVEAFTGQLEQHQYSAYQATGDSVRLNADGDGTDGLIRILLRVLGQQTDLAKTLWASGLTLETVTVDQANDLKKRLEAEGADVTLVESSFDEYTVSGRVTQRDGASIVGARVRAIEKRVVSAQNQTLGEVRSSEEGAYVVRYAVEGEALPD